VGVVADSLEVDLAAEVVVAGKYACVVFAGQSMKPIKTIKGFKNRGASSASLFQIRCANVFTNSYNTYEWPK
jgi:hypothetical protein